MNPEISKARKVIGWVTAGVSKESHMNKTHKYFPVATILVTLTIFTACTNGARMDGATEENKSLIQRYIDEMNSGNRSFMDVYLGANYIYHGPAGDLSREEFIAQHDMMLHAFPDAMLTAEDMIAEGDKVTTRWKMRGTHTGDFQGMAPTGKEVTLLGIIITRVENGKAVEEWELMDQFGLLQQLGAIPPPPVSGQ